MVLGIWYNQSIQNPRPNTCWFLIMNLVSHDVLTFLQTNSVKEFFLHGNALAFKMKTCKHDLISRGESGIAPKVFIFSVREHLVFKLLNAQITEKLNTSFLVQKINFSFSCYLTTYVLNFKMILLLSLFFKILLIFRV